MLTEDTIKSFDEFKVEYGIVCRQAIDDQESYVPHDLLRVISNYHQ